MNFRTTFVPFSNAVFSSLILIVLLVVVVALLLRDRRSGPLLKIVQLRIGRTYESRKILTAMSEARRGRRPRIHQNKGNENELNGKGVVILAKKEPREKPKDDERLDSQDDAHRRDETTSPFLLRNNRLRMVAQKPPTIQTKSVAVKAVENALRTGSEERERPTNLRGVDKSEMTQRAKFLNKFGELEDDFLQFLTEDASFKVIGVIGLQSSGKSHTLNTLAGRAVFPVEKVDDAEQCRHRTVGVDAFVTSDRTILLDMQPLLALSTMDGFIQSEKRTPSGAIDYHQSLESQVMIESLQTACFLLSICHTVVVTFDWFLDRDLAQFLQSAEMLKPTTPKTTTTNMLDDEISDYFPHVVFVKNRSDFINLKDNRAMAVELGRVFKDSMLLFRDGVTNSLGKAVPEEAVNIFQVPLKTDPLYDTVCRDLLSKVLSMPQEEFVLNPPRAFSERQWFQHSAKIWDIIKKSSMFQEYKRLLV